LTFILATAHFSNPLSRKLRHKWTVILINAAVTYIAISLLSSAARITLEPQQRARVIQTAVSHTSLHSTVFGAVVYCGF